MMRNTPFLFALALAPCAATRRLVVRHDERTSSAALGDTDSRLRTEVDSLAGALGHWFELSKVPPASRVPLAHAFLRQEADRLEQTYGDSAGMRAFRRHMADLLPTGALFPGASSFLDGGESAPVTGSATALQDGQGRLVANMTRCVGGNCATTSRTADASAILETMQRAGPELPGALQRMLGEGNETEKALADLAELPEDFKGTLANVFDSILDGLRPEGKLQIPLLESVANSTGGDLFENMTRGVLGHGGFPSVWTTTEIENGQTVRKTKTCTASGCATETCKGSDCTTETREFAVHAGGVGGQQLPTHDL